MCHELNTRHLPAKLIGSHLDLPKWSKVVRVLFHVESPFCACIAGSEYYGYIAIDQIYTLRYPCSFLFHLALLIIPTSCLQEPAMSDHGDEEDRRLLDELAADPRSHEYDVEAKGSPARSTGSSIWVSLGFLFIAVLLTLPFLGYVRHLDSSATGASPTAKQLAIPLHPEKHVRRRAKTLEFHWNVTLGTMAPDGVEKQVYLVNGRLSLYDLQLEFAAGLNNHRRISWSNHRGTVWG